MKLIFATSIFLILVSCGNKEAEERVEQIKKENLSIPQNVRVVSAIGKIEPEEGLVSISSEKGGIVLKVFKKSGDSVAAGEIILTLKSVSENANEKVIENQILVQQKQVEADFSTIAQYQAQLSEKQKDLAITEKLAKTGADTQQNVDTKRKDLKVILANLNTARKNTETARANIAVLRAQFEEAKISTSDMTVRAVQNGILVGLEATPGTAISALTSFATLAPAGKIVVHGEVDEMFASKIILGNSVTIMSPGTKNILTKGKIIFLSPILEDKTIFYELAGEQNDRRVRRFKAELDRPQNLLINQKVQCDIQVD